jgi:membrane protein DedA with SNARE-associated domain
MMRQPLLLRNDGSGYDEAVNDTQIEAKRAATHRFLAGLGGIILTTTIGSLGVFATYYPLQDAGFVWQWLLVFLLMTGESAAIHLPSEVILPVGGWLVVRNHDLGLAGIVGLSVVAALGNTLGSTLLYCGGRFGGRSLVRRYGRYFLIHESDLDAAEARSSRHRYWALFASRMLPVVRTYGGFVAGLLRMPVLPFAAITFAGSFVWSALFIVLGVELGQNWGAIRGPAEVAGAVVVVLLIAGLAISTFRLRASAAKAGEASD